MHGGKVEICGVNTSKLKVLTAKEKEELLKKAHEGGVEVVYCFYETYAPNLK